MSVIARWRQLVRVKKKPPERAAAAFNRIAKDWEAARLSQRYFADHRDPII